MILNAQTYTLERYTRSEVDGVFVSSGPSTSTVSGNLQPMSAGELKGAPEGFTQKPGRKFKFYTLPGVDLRHEVGVGYEPDRIVYQGARLFVWGLRDFTQGLLGHKRWLLYEPSTEVGR